MCNFGKESCPKVRNLVHLYAIVQLRAPLGNFIELIPSLRQTIRPEMGKACRDMAEALRDCMVQQECMADGTKTLKQCLHDRAYSHECQVRRLPAVAGRADEFELSCRYC